MVKNLLAMQEKQFQSMGLEDLLEKEIASHFSICAAAAAAKSLQSCPTLCDPIDISPPGSPDPGILQPSTAISK